MPKPKEPCEEGKAPASGVPVDHVVTRVTTFGERLGEESPPRRKRPPDHGPLPVAHSVDPERVLNREEGRDEPLRRRVEIPRDLEEEKK